MNSKGIKPRVGMVVRLIMPDEFIEDAKTIRRVGKDGGLWFKDEGKLRRDSRVSFFMEGNYDILWTPPTKEERAKWRKAARKFRALAKARRGRGLGVDDLPDDSEESEFLWRFPLIDDDISVLRTPTEETYDICAQIAESLALDGS